MRDALTPTVILTRLRLIYLINMDTVVVPKALKILNLCVFWYNRDHTVHCLPKILPTDFSLFEF